MAFMDIENLENTQYSLLTWLMWGTGLLLTFVRLLARYLHQGRWFYDDGLQIAAMFSLTGLATVTELQRDTIYGLKMAAIVGMGSANDGTSVTTDATREQAKLQFISIHLFWVCLWSIKASLLIFYRRLFFKLNGYMKWWWLVTIACIATFGACILANFLECLPLHRRLLLGLEGSCPAMNGTVFLAITTSFDIATDIFLIILPIRLLRGLQISMGQKIAIGGVFMLSILTITFSILRIKKVYASLSSMDPNFNVSLALWSVVEASVAVVVGALPSLKILVEQRGDPNRARSVLKPKYPHSPELDTAHPSNNLGRSGASIYVTDKTKTCRKGPQDVDGEEGIGGIMLEDVRKSSQTLVSVESKHLESGDGVSVESFIHA